MKEGRLSINGFNKDSASKIDSLPTTAGNVVTASTNDAYKIRKDIFAISKWKGINLTCTVLVKT